MASTTTAPSSPGSRADSITPFEWIQLHSKALTIALVVALAAGAGYALWKRSAAIKEERAEKAYFQALRSAQSGNQQLAQSDLEKLIGRYSGTSAATQGAISLATLHFEARNYAKGIQVLESIKAQGAPESFIASIDALIAAGYSDNGKHAEAAASYRSAAEKAEFPADRDAYLAEAARELTAASRPQDALAIWRRLAENPESATAPEAHVRIGELTARPAK